MNQLLIVMAVSASLAAGQVTDPTKPVTPAKSGDVIKVLNIKAEAAPNRNNPTVNTLRGMYPAGSGVEMVFDEVNRTLVVRGPAAAVKLIEDALKTIDVPAPPASVANVEVTIQLLYASAKEDAKNSVPADLQASVQELRKVFPYTSYRVMDTLLTRGRDDQSVDDGGTLAGAAPPFNTYQLRYIPRIGPKASQRTIRLRNLSLNMRPSNNLNMGLATDIDAREGQKTVVGKINVPGTEDAIFVVITPKVIE